jgi:hypothetical protein
MESTPHDPHNSEVKPHSITDEKTHHRLGARALHPPYEAYEDAHSANGGGVPPYKTEVAEQVYPTGLHETVLFTDRRQRGAVDPRYFEIIRAYDLSLDVLTSSQFRQMSLNEQMRVAVAGHEVIARTESRAMVLGVDGNFENPTFQQYGFQSQQEADVYAAQLKILQHDLMTRDVVTDIELAYRALKSKSNRATMTQLAKQTRNLIITIDEGGTAVVKNKPVSE